MDTIFYPVTANPLGYFLAHFPGLPHILGDLTSEGFPLVKSWEDLRKDFPGVIVDAAQPTADQVAAWVPEVVEPEPDPPLTDVEILAASIQARLDQRQLERTGVRPDPAGAVPRSRALAAAAMSLGGWGYPSEADLTGDSEVVAILAALYADPTSNTTAESSNTAKRRAVQYVRIMAEGAAFGEEYSDALTAYERTASPGIQAAITADQRTWMALACGPWETVKAMFLALLK